MGVKMINELLTWLGVGAVLLLAWTLYLSTPKDDDDELVERVPDDGN